MSSQTDHELPTDIINALNLRIDNLVLLLQDLTRRVEDADPGIHYFITPSERHWLRDQSDHVPIGSVMVT